MRGRNLLWIALIVVLVGPMLIGSVESAVTDTVISVEPTIVTGMPGDYFTIDVMISHGEDVYGWGIDLYIVPFVRVLKFVEAIEGDFLMRGGTTFMVSFENVDYGLISVGNTLIGGCPLGVSGDGTLVTLLFLVVEAGWSPLDLENTKLVNCFIEELPHREFDGQYNGPVGNLVMVGAEQRDMTVGGTQIFRSRVKNEANVPLYMRVKYEMVREDGLTLTNFAGHTRYATENVYETHYLYVNSFDPYWADWTTVGTDPWLDDVDGDYITGDAHCQIMGIFGFEDIALPPDYEIYKVEYESYNEGPYDEGMDIDVYCWDPSPFVWIGSSYCKGAAQWVEGTRWSTDPVSDVIPETLTQEGLNGFTILLHYYGNSYPLHTIKIDSIRLKVTLFLPASVPTGYPPYILVEPNDNVPVPDFYWPLGEDAVGKYQVTAYAEYRYNVPDPRFPNQPWIKSDKVKTFTWWASP